MLWDRERQRKAHEKYKRKSLRALGRWIRDHEEEILAAADEREDSGFETYGDEMYRWDYSTLHRNKIEEIADYVVYDCSGRARGWLK